MTMPPDEAKIARRTKRAERRLKQRAENAGRAQKMHEARLAYEKEPEFKAQGKLPKLNIGCSGWFYWHWKGGFYPDEMKTSEWFDRYSKVFKTVELNAPFYSWPTVATVKSWLRQAGRKQFVYTVKVSELITHVKQFKSTQILVQDFGLIADLLGKRMGCFLYQLPPSFHYSPARLKMILSQLDHRRRNVVEFRHKSWWNEKVYDAFRETGTIFCSCSGPKLPDELIKTANDIYVRFHGIEKWYRHDYSKAELAEWAERIRNCKAEHVFVYFNNDWNEFAIKNAKELIRLLKKDSD